MYLLELLLLSKHQIDCCSLPGEASDKDCVFVKSAATRDWKIDSCTAENYYLCQYDSEQINNIRSERQVKSVT